MQALRRFRRRDPFVLSVRRMLYPVCRMTAKFSAEGVFSGPATVFVEGDVECPVKTLDAPMGALRQEGPCSSEVM